MSELAEEQGALLLLPSLLLLLVGITELNGPTKLRKWPSLLRPKFKKAVIQGKDAGITDDDDENDEEEDKGVTLEEDRFEDEAKKWGSRTGDAAGEEETESDEPRDAEGKGESGDKDSGDGEGEMGEGDDDIEGESEGEELRERSRRCLKT